MSDAVLRWWRPPGLPTGQTVSGSPYTYTNVSAGAQIVTMTSGTVLSVTLDVGLGPVVSVLNTWTLFPSQTLVMTYIVAPTVTVQQL